MKMFLKTFAIIMIVISSSLFVGETRAQTNNIGVPTQFISIGSTDAVMAAQVALVDYLSVIIWQTQTNGVDMMVCYIETNRSFSSIQVLDTINSAFVVEAARKVLLTTNVAVRLDLPFRAESNALIGGNMILYQSYPFNLVASLNSHALPTFPATIHMGLYAPSCAFRVPQIKSVIAEAFISNVWTVVSDSRLTPGREWYVPRNGIGGGVDPNFQLLVIAPERVVGNYPVRLSIVNGNNNSFTLVNETGYQIAETPTVMNNPVMTNGTLLLHGSGGDPGRFIVIQCSPDMSSWTDLPIFHSVGYLGADTGISYSGRFTASKMFFRIKKINMAF